MRSSAGFTTNFSKGLLPRPVIIRKTRLPVGGLPNIPNNPPPLPPDYTGFFKGFIDEVERFRYLILLDWDTCDLGDGYALTSESIKIYDGSTEEVWSTVPTHDSIDGYVVYEAQGDGTAKCVHATGNYTVRVPIDSVVSVSDYDSIAAASGVAFSNSVRGTEIGSESYCYNPSPSTQKIPSFIVCESWTPLP